MLVGTQQLAGTESPANLSDQRLLLWEVCLLLMTTSTFWSMTLEQKSISKLGAQCTLTKCKECPLAFCQTKRRKVAQSDQNEGAVSSVRLAGACQLHRPRSVTKAS